jgi:hypothetical protein
VDPQEPFPCSAVFPESVEAGFTPSGSEVLTLPFEAAGDFLSALSSINASRAVVRMRAHPS